MNKSALLLLSLLLTLNIQAQTPAPKPGPDQKKLEVWAGDWKYKGTGYATPLGKPGTFAGTQKTRMSLNRFFLESRWLDKADSGEDKGLVSQGLEIDGYDTAKKNYTISVWEGDGAFSTGSMTVSGNCWTSVSTRTGSDGKAYQTRGVTTFSEDGKRATVKMELSSDGTTWMPSYDLVMTKTRSSR